MAKTDRDKNMRRGLAYWRWRFIDNFARRLPRDARRSDDPTEAALDAELLREGLLVESAKKLLSDTGIAALEEIAGSLALSPGDRAHVDELPSSGKKGYVTHFVPKVVAGDSPYLRLALDPKLLGHASRYLGFQPFLYDIKGWLNSPSPEPAAQSQLWHRDPEDRHMLKVFFYLVDVDASTGPFEFIPQTHGKGRHGPVRVPHAHRKRILDEEIAPVFPPATWRRCTGPANTAILADTTGFHRGGRVERGRRALVTMTYTSSHPVTLAERRVEIAGSPTFALDALQRAALQRSRSSH
jgi:hypothetical protein